MRKEDLSPSFGEIPSKIIGMCEGGRAENKKMREDCEGDLVSFFFLGFKTTTILDFYY